MLTRVLTAVVALAVVLPILVYGGNIGMVGLMAVVTAICQLEYVRMSPGALGLKLRFWEVLAGLAIFISIQTLDPLVILMAMAFAVIGTFFFHLGHLEPMETAATRWAFSMAGLFYAPLLLAFLPLLRDLPHGLDWLFLVMIITWAGDTGAYLAGRAFGRTKLYPAVSPKKTVEGVAGGALLSIGGALVARATFFPELSVMDCVILAPVADLAGVAGDLCESLLKRCAGVKDSGNILPGHGGMLDRLDSLLFSAPLVFGYAVFLF